MPEMLDYFEGKRILDKYGIRSVESRYVASPEDAEKFSRAGPIALKLISPKALHKSKAGLVMLNVQPGKAASAYSELVRKGGALKPYRIIAQRMSKGGVEIIVGGRTDPQFGKLILIGLGGIYVEAFKDFALRVCPIDRDDAAEMIGQLRSRDIVTFNGADTDMLVGLLMKVSRLLTHNKDISEIDLNPLIVRSGGYEAVDIRILTG